MTPYEKIEHLFSEVRNHPGKNTTEFFTVVIENMFALTKEQRGKVAHGFYDWAKENSSLQPLNICYATQILASDAFFNEQYETMFALCDEAQKLFAEENNPDGVALASGLCGSGYRTLGNMDLGLKYLWEALEQLNKSGAFPYYNMASSFNIGGIYYDMHHYTEALPMFQQTLKKAEALNNKIWMAHASNGIGNVFLRQKKYPEAKEFLEKALAIGEEENLQLVKAKSYTDLGSYYSDTRNYEKAEEFHKKALEIREEIKQVGGAITNMIHLGEIFVKDGKKEEAIQMLERGLKMATEIRVKPKMYQVHFLLSEIYQSMNDADRSLHHYKLYHQLREEVEIEDAAKKIKNFQLIFEAEQTKKENVIIKKQKKEIETKNIELQNTIDELTRARVSKKAKAITLVVAVALLIVDEILTQVFHHYYHVENIFIAFGIKALIVFSLKPIEKAIEHSLLNRLVKKKVHVEELMAA